MNLSIVIPAYREAAKIARDVEAAGTFLAQERLEGEILVVDDGSADGTAEAVERPDLPAGVRRRVLRYTPHRGKGFAVRTGMAETRGEYVLLTDSGLCVPMACALKGLEMIRAGACDIAHGSRRLTQSVIRRPQPIRRRLLSRLAGAAVRAATGVPKDLTDTQCGFKVYRGDAARELYAQCRTDGFLFDIEIILRAARRGYSIREFPVEWVCDLDSRLHPGRNLWRTAKELLEIRRTLRREP